MPIQCVGEFERRPGDQQILALADGQTVITGKRYGLAWTDFRASSTEDTASEIHNGSRFARVDGVDRTGRLTGATVGRGTEGWGDLGLSLIHI